MNIDVHGHIVVKELLKSPEQMESWRYELITASGGGKLLRSERRTNGPIPREPVELPKIIEHLDATRVDVMAVSVSPTHMYYELDDRTGLSTSRVVNDAIAAAVAAYPKRFVGLGNLPLQNLELSIEELRRLVGELKMPGIQLGSSLGGAYLGADRFRPLWEVIQGLDVFVFVHPNDVIGADRLREYYLGNLIGNPVETARCIADVVFSGLLEQFPKLKICFAHAGGAAPFLWGRWEHGYRWRTEPRAKINRPPSEYLKLLYFDTISHSAAGLEYLLRQVGADHVALGSDYPFDMGPEEPVGFVESVPGLSEEEKRKILHDTPARLLKLA